MIVAINFDKHPDNADAKQGVFDMEGNEVELKELIGCRIYDAGLVERVIRLDLRKDQ